MKRTLPFLLAFSLAACSSSTSKFPFSAFVPDMPKHTTETRSDEARSAKWICVLQPSDASYFGDVARDSGKAVAGIVRSSLQKIGIPSVQVHQVQTNAHADCQARGASRFLQISFLHYEDRSNQLFGKPDRIELKLTLYTVDDLDKRQSVVYEAQTNKLRRAILEWGNNNPTALLGDEFDKVVWQLVQMESSHADSFGVD